MHSSGVFVYASEHVAQQTDLQEAEVDVNSSPSTSQQDSESECMQFAEASLRIGPKVLRNFHFLSGSDLFIN